jgi:hypothetical protein
MMKLRVAVVAIAAAVALSLTSPPPPGACDGLRGMAPTPRLPLSIKDLGTGSTRVVNAEGGWSLLVPSDWSVRPSIFGNTGFGQASISSYNPDGMPYSGNIGPGFLPTSTGVRLDIEVWANPNKLDPAQYAASLHLFGDQAGFEVEQMVPVGGQVAFRAVVKEDHLVGQGANGPIITRQSRLLWVVPVLGSDRLLVLDAWPRENPLIATADSIVSTLLLSTPVVARVPVTFSRDQVLHKWLYDADGVKIPGRRAEAKLMTDAEFTEALPAISSSFGLDLVSRSLRINEDPGKLLWVVVVSGGDLGHDWRQTQPNYTWIFFTAAATSETLPIDLKIYSTGSDPPSVFDDLTDLCR